jgi:hypothetical protein
VAVARRRRTPANSPRGVSTGVAATRPARPSGYSGDPPGTGLPLDDADLSTRKNRSRGSFDLPASSSLNSRRAAGKCS